MSNKSPMESKRNKVLKIIIPVLFLCVVAGIWTVKNFQREVDSADSINPDFTLHVTEEIDLEKLKSYGLPIIIDFGADSCIPCREMAPVLEELNEELQGKAIIKFVDVWKYDGVAKGYPVRVIPTQIFIDSNGKPYNPKDPEAMQMKLYIRNSGEPVFTAHEGGMTKEMLLDILKEMGIE